MYRVELSKKAFRSLKKLDPRTRLRILEKLMSLREEPIPRSAAKLRGEKHAYRLRVGDYRILYKILWKEETILIFKIEHRRKAYRKS
ncbi:MAG: type II toxin-antitoxin system RelE/ParE family toxin [Thermoprotei archaeon]|nr:MAG: type II toxin-antitoxin system RelE/ParE family toxin [Thermoprotei archaeon]